MPTRQSYEQMTVAELEEKARDAGIKGYSDMKKADLVQALEKQLPSQGGQEKSSSRPKKSGSYPGVLQLIKQEHDEVKQYFDEFEKQSEKDLAGTRQLVDVILDELMRHAEMEEQLVYPALEQQDEELYHEAHEQHHVAELLIQELQGMKPDEVYKAKVTVLAETTRHHIEEEESEAFEQLEKLGSQKLEEMASQWEQAKRQWKAKAGSR
ncbi:MAG: hemerythrin domain-containing protein [Hyphomicrobiales bacterium]